MQLLISGSWWLLALCLLMGTAYAYLLYRRSFKNNFHKLAAIFRALLVSILCFFLLNPVLVSVRNNVEKPKILMLLDNSESVFAGKNAESKNAFSQSWFGIRKELGDKYEVVYLTTGSKTELSDSADFRDKKTNLSEAFDYINNTFDRQNIGAIVLASDGIYNRGSNPLFKEIRQHAPVYTIGLGDSTFKKDLILREANTNAIAYLNNEFPIEIDIAARFLKDKNTSLNISHEGKILHTQNIGIDNNDFFRSLTVNLPAEKPGTLHLVVSLNAIEGEHSIINNKKDVFIEIIDGREKILLTYSGVHPDVGALKDAISTNQNYEVVVTPFNKINYSELGQYSVAILHQLPSAGNNPKQLVSELRKNNVPIWLITGAASQTEQLNLVSPFGRIDRSQGRFNESQATLNPAFNLFTTEASSRNTIPQLPPLKSAYGQYSSSDNLDVFLYQKIGSVNTKIPLWAFSNENGQKTAFLFGEGFWKWRMIDFSENESHLATNEMVSKTIQFLASKEDKRKFRAYPGKNIYDEDENVKFYAELYNASYELVNTVDVKFNLINSEKKVYNYTFSKSGKSYLLDLGPLAPGNYTYSAKADGVSESINGKLTISPLQTELIETKADFALLRDISKKNQGSFFNNDQLQNLIKTIQANEKISSVNYREKSPEDLINLKWVFALLLILLSAEWFIRKYEGTY